MYLCCVESLSRFRSKWDFLRIFKVVQKLSQVQGSDVKIPNFKENFSPYN